MVDMASQLHFTCVGNFSCEIWRIKVLGDHKILLSKYAGCTNRVYYHTAKVSVICLHS